MRPNMVYYDMLGEDFDPYWTIRTSILNYPKDVGCSLTSNQILIVGDTTIAKLSNNGGDSFSTLTLPTLTDIQCCDIGIHNNLLVGGKNATGDRMWFSSDGGSNWTKSAPNVGLFVGDCSINANGRCVIVGNSKVFTSTDGINWTDRTVAAGIDASSDLNTCSIGPNNEIIIGGQVIKISTDGGASWTDRTTEVGTGPGTSAYSSHIDELTGKMMIGRQNSVVRVSTNGGLSWSSLTLNPSVFGRLDACAIYNNFMVIGSPSKLRSSDNSGTTWNVVISPERSVTGADASRYVMAACYTGGGGLATRKLG